jgi:hypothetical protein
MQSVRFDRIDFPVGTPFRDQQRRDAQNEAADGGDHESNKRIE